MIKHGDVLGLNAFTAAGAAKAISRAIAARAREEHASGRPFKVGMITGASTGPSLDGELAKADAVSFRTPFQSDADMRKAINEGKVQFFDMHLSALQNRRHRRIQHRRRNQRFPASRRRGSAHR